MSIYLHIERCLDGNLIFEIHNSHLKWAMSKSCKAIDWLIVIFFIFVDHNRAEIKSVRAIADYSSN